MEKEKREEERANDDGVCCCLSHFLVDGQDDDDDEDDEDTDEEAMRTESKNFVASMKNDAMEMKELSDVPFSAGIDADAGGACLVVVFADHDKQNREETEEDDVAAWYCWKMCASCYPALLCFVDLVSTLYLLLLRFLQFGFFLLPGLPLGDHERGCVPHSGMMMTRRRS